MDRPFGKMVRVRMRMRKRRARGRTECTRGMEDPREEGESVQKVERRSGWRNDWDGGMK